MTLLFAIAECNGTLARLTGYATRACRGHAGVLPIMFFAIGFVVATIGAGPRHRSALLAPPAMAVAARAGIPAAADGNRDRQWRGCAGTLSPFAPTGIVAHGVMQRINLGGVEWQTFALDALHHHTIVGFGGFLLLGGWRLFVRRNEAAQPEDPVAGAMDARHWMTTAGIIVLIGTVAGLGMNVGMMGLLVATALHPAAHGE